ncbi:putative HAF family extracellular repeat protein [Catenulispora sp. MAP12-49]
MHSSGRRTAVRAARVAALCVALAVPIPFAAPAGAAAAPLYTVTDLGTLGGDLSVANGINNAGVVVGYSDLASGSQHGFRWSAGTMSDLGVEAGGGDSVANAVNDAGQVAGEATRSDGGYAYPVRWSAAGVLQDLGGPVTNRLGVGNAIDPSGRVAGGQRPADSEGSPEAILYDTAGNPTELSTPTQTLGAATGINARGQVVGGPAFVWQNGTLTMLPVLPGGQGGSANAINVSGTIVGTVGRTGTLGGLDAALWQNNTLTDLGTIDGIQYNQATAINAAGQIVGTADPECQPCAAPEAWLRQPGGALTALDTLIPAGSGWTLQGATGVNDRGQIVGVGLHNGHKRAYLLTPAFAATVNFEPAGAPVPTGYAADTGAVYGARSGGLTYGWNIDNAVNTRDRDSATSPDQRYDTLIHMERTGSATVWELAVPNGRYTVHVVSGDPDNIDSVYKISVEGVLTVSGTPTAANHWIEGTSLVTVSDGRLTITNAAGSSNDKLDYVDVIAS